MKKYIFKIALLLGVLLVMGSCQKDAFEPYSGDPQIAFRFPLTPLVTNPAMFVGTVASIPLETRAVPRTGAYTLDYPVDLRFSAGWPAQDINFTISVMDVNDITSGPAALNTINPEAIGFETSGVIKAGEGQGTFKITIDWSKLSATGTENEIYLLLSAESSSVIAAPGYRRVRLRFTKTDGNFVLAANTLTPTPHFINLAGNVTQAGGTAVTHVGFIYATDTTTWREFNLNSGAVTRLAATPGSATTGQGAFSAVLNAPQDAAQRFFVRSYAINGTDTIYSPALTAAPTAVSTTVFGGGETTLAAPNFTALNTATVIMQLATLQDTTWISGTTLRDTILETGIVWAFNKTAPDTTDNRIKGKLKKRGADTLQMVTNFTTPGNLVVRAYAISYSGRISYSTAQTVELLLPVGRTLAVTTTTITDSSATLRGQLDFNGGVVLGAAGFVYGTVDGVWTDTVRAATAAIPAAGAVMSLPVTKLAPETQYFYRAYFTNRWGLKVYGDTRNFTTAKKD